MDKLPNHELMGYLALELDATKFAVMALRDWKLLLDILKEAGAWECVPKFITVGSALERDLSVEKFAKPPLPTTKDADVA